VDLIMNERQGIEIDYCPQCRGVWLDRGELDKIIERSQRQLRERSPTRAAEDSAGHDGHHGSRRHGAFGGHRRSWLQKIFD